MQPCVSEDPANLLARAIEVESIARATIITAKPQRSPRCILPAGRDRREADDTGCLERSAKIARPANNSLSTHSDGTTFDRIPAACDQGSRWTSRCAWTSWDQFRRIWRRVQYVTKWNEGGVAIPRSMSGVGR